MSQPNTILKSFAQFAGIDLRSSDLVRKPNFASNLKNLDFRKTGAIDKRKGFQAKEESHGGYGTAMYSDVDSVTGQITEKLITIDENMWEKTTGSLNITYSGSETAYADIYNDGTDFYLDLYDDNTQVLHFAMGTGVEEATPITIANVKTAIDAITDFSSTITGSTTNTSAFLDIVRNKDITTATEFEFSEQTQVSNPTGASSPFTLTQTKVDQDDFENASFANINNVLYVCTGYDALFKFDGVRCYKAGMPQIAEPTSVINGAGSVTGTNIQYMAVYSYTDAKGNLVEGIETVGDTKISPSSNQVDVTLTNILQASGYDTDSSLLKIRLYRNLTADSITYYFVDEITNDGTTATQVYSDNIASASLGAEYIYPIKPHGLPPIGKYCTIVQGLLAVGGDNASVNTVYYSDIDSAEYFPAGDNSFNVDTSFGDKVTGLAPLGNSLFVFKNRSVFGVNGSIAEDKFRVDLFSKSRVGCVSHASIQEVKGQLVFLSDKGVFTVNPQSQSTEELSDAVEPLFKGKNVKQATAINWVEKDKYVLYVPTKTDDYEVSSTVFVFDYFRGAWLLWDNINAMGGLSIVDSELYFIERRNSVVESGTARFLYKMLDSGDTWDYADHTSAINFSFSSHWEALNDPSIFKKYLRLKIHSLDASINDFESDSFSLDVRTEKDFIDEPHTETTLSFAGDSSGQWGVGEWGRFAWGGSRVLAKRTKLRSGKAVSMRLILTNSNLHENILVSGYEIEVVTPYLPFIKE